MRALRNIPEELKAVPHWVTRGISGGGAADRKKPYNPNTNAPARVNNPNTWATFEACEKAVRRARYSGLGFVFTGDYLVIDLDNVIDARGNVLRDAARIIEAVDSYTEKSLSGRGFHIIAHKPPFEIGVNRASFALDEATLARFTREELDRATGELREKRPGIEFYDSGRYMALTGDVYQGRDTIREAPEALERVYSAYVADARATQAPTAPRAERYATCGNLETVRARMFRGRNRDQIRQLWSGDVSAWGSESEAALRLCDHLAFYTDKDPAQMAALFRQSGLYRAKCDEPRGNGKTWLDVVIAKAMAKPMATYSEYVQVHRSPYKAG